MKMSGSRSRSASGFRLRLRLTHEETGKVDARTDDLLD